MTMETSFELSLNALKPEGRLLLCCARMHIDADTAEQINALLKESLAWDTLLHLAFQHDVVPFLYRILESVPTSAMPAAVRANLKRQMQVDIQGNLSLTKELLRLKALFDEERIAMIPYKGPVLAAAVYRDLAARPFTDLDILIQADDIPQAVELLTSYGYQIVRPKSLTQARQTLQALWLQQLVKRSPWAYQIVLWHPDLETMVEIHWRVMSKYIFSSKAEQLWENLQPISLAGSSLPSLSPENLLWFLCVHASKHRWERLRWLCDIAELIRTYPQLDWNQIIQQAMHLKVQRRLYIGLLLANRLLGAPLPGAVEERINQAPQLKILAQHVIDGLFEQSKKTNRFLDIPELRFQLNSMDRLTDRFRYFLRYFNALETVVTTERMLVKPFSFLSISSPLLRLFE
jgi:hypothetical protein